jgi:ribosomal protein S18 acetylase RimI-like enzyme
VHIADPGTTRVSLRPFALSDRTGVSRLLATLPTLYPNGGQWLDARLTDAYEGRARCTLATVQGLLAGVLIETPKGRQALKLSTVYVGPTYRMIGIGSRLIQHARNLWYRDDPQHVYVTVAAEGTTGVDAFFRAQGFRDIDISTDRYGIGRDELIMSWQPSHFQL